MRPVIYVTRLAQAMLCVGMRGSISPALLGLRLLSG